MPRKPHPPAYCTYRAANGTEYARCKVFGAWVSLGLAGSEESKQAYQAALARWREGRTSQPASVTIADLTGLWFAHVEREGLYLRADGSETGERMAWRYSLAPLVRLYGPSPAASFGPLALRAVRDAMLSGDWLTAAEVAERARIGMRRNALTRSVANQRVGRIVRLFRFAVAEELVPPAVYAALQAVSPLPRGTKRAKETAPIPPAPEQDVMDVLPLLPPMIRAMALLQLATGMRPGEVCGMKKEDIDQRGAVGSCWVWRPNWHKTAKHGVTRAVPLGPAVQIVLGPWIIREGEYLFPSSNGGPSRVDSYGHTFAKVCRRAGVPLIRPNQLRKTAATAIEAAVDLDSARAMLGHTTAATTKKHYARADLQKVAKIAGKMG